MIRKSIIFSTSGVFSETFSSIVSSTILRSVISSAPAKSVASSAIFRFLVFVSSTTSVISSLTENSFLFSSDVFSSVAGLLAVTSSVPRPSVTCSERVSSAVPTTAAVEPLPTSANILQEESTHLISDIILFPCC